MKLSKIKQELCNGKKIEELVEVKSFISLATKKALVDNILNACLDYDENGLLKCDFISKELSYNLNLLNFYTDIELDGEDIAEDYDYLDKERIFHFIRDNIPELYVIEYLLGNELEQKLELENNISAVVNRNLVRFIDVVEKNTSPKNIKSIIKAASKAFKDLDIDKLNFVSDAIKLNNGLSPATKKSVKK